MNAVHKKLVKKPVKKMPAVKKAKAAPAKAVKRTVKSPEPAHASHAKKGARTVQSILTGEKICVYVPGSRSDALRVLGKYDISGAPVVQKKTEQLVGVVTRTDILRKPDEEQLALLMNKNPITIKSNDTLEKAASIFHEKQIRCLPVIDGKGILIGTIRPMDVLNAYSEEITDVVGDCLTGCSVPIFQDTPVPVVMTILNITKATALPILDGEGKLSGIVADGDLFKFSTEEEKAAMSRFGIGGSDDKLSWEGVRDAMLLYHQTTKTKLPEVPVKQVMVKDPISVFKDAPVKVAIWKMRKYNFNQLPVVDEKNNLVGVVSDLDMIASILK
ncbi:MAG: CBS domain-containing protein [Candidatus Thermoplasmatota archaeon]|nr:CBS domain-containing protein [Candidatus Thermoplasmatota archaeon]